VKAQKPEDSAVESCVHSRDYFIRFKERSFLQVKFLPGKVGSAN
jgi:hypothetical protein